MQNTHSTSGDLFTWSPPLAPDDPGHYPFTPGFREATTSREAAAMAKAHANAIRNEVTRLLEIEPAGLGVHQIAARLKLPVPSVQPRISELKRLGKLCSSGRRCRNDSGASAHIWILSTQGEASRNV